MASMYLLKHPDHYTSHQFRVCFWKSYVYEVMRDWEDSPNIIEEGINKVMLSFKKQNNNDRPKKVVAISPVMDYMWRPHQYESMSMYDWDWEFSQVQAMAADVSGGSDWSWQGGMSFGL